MNDKDEKKPLWMWIALIVLSIIGVNIVSFFGYAMETAADENAAPVINLMNGIMAISKGEVKFSLFTNIGAFFENNGATRKATILGCMAAVIGLMYFKYGNGKRYHKKGIEHGSAKWGDQKEKDMIADTTPDGFYNNVIVASDVFLVLDRKQRDKNEEKQKRGNAINKSSKENESKGQEDKAHAES
ncbi:MAG: hypothetical protein J6N70_07805 [Oribacterium sp.]|nr:hypothetical protein [Oribacterium sp.]